MRFNTKGKLWAKSQDSQQEAMPTAKVNLMMTIRKELRDSRSLPTERTLRFITADAVREVMTTERIDLLLKDLGPKHVERAGKHLRQVLAILIHIKWNDWPQFEEIFLRETDSFDRPERGDHHLPFLDLNFLEEDVREEFDEAQYLFRPIIIQGNTHLIYSEKHRLPFLKSEMIGDGGFGTVTKVLVEKKQLKYNTDTIRGLYSKVRPPSQICEVCFSQVWVSLAKIDGA